MTATEPAETIRFLPGACFTPEEYIALERKALDKHEFRDGKLFTMPGASRKHNLISINLSTEIHIQLRDRDCEVYANDMRVLVQADGLYCYPDVVAVCGEPHFLDAELDTLTNPTLVIEVLSPSTQAWDRGEKYRRYQSVPSLQTIVFVAQDTMHVELKRREDDQWVSEAWSAPEAVVPLASIDCQIALRDIYEKVVFGA